MENQSLRETKILVSDILELLSAGKTIEEILRENPKLTEEMPRRL